MADKFHSLLKLFRERSRSFPIYGLLFYVFLAATIYWTISLVALSCSTWEILTLYWSFSFVFFWALFRLSKWAFFPFYVILSLVLITLLPNKILWGGVTIRQMLLVSLYSNSSEIGEYFSMLPLSAYTFIAIALVTIVLTLYFGWKYDQTKASTPNPRRLFLHLTTSTLVVLGLIGLMKNPVKIWFLDTPLSREFKSIHVQEYGARVCNNILGVVAYQVYLALHEIYSMNKAFDTPPSWKLSEVNPQYQDYVLIIGESAAADYMSLYGYPIQNSSFLESCPNIKIALDYYSPAPNTANSLIRYLSWSNNDIDPPTSEYVLSDNIVSLSKAAGFQTYWISTQRRIEGNRSPIGYMAETAEYVEFICDEPFWGGRCKDAHLLPKFEECVLSPTDGRPRLFVIHLMGSHFVFEERLEGPLKYNHYNPSISAYLQTLSQTDQLIGNIYRVLNSTGRSYSITYFSDHGVEANTDASTLIHPEGSGGYHVPFIQISSGEEGRAKYSGVKHGGNFIHGFANWIGVSEPRLDKSYSFFEPNIMDSTRMFYGMDGRYVRLEHIPPRPILGK